MLDERKARNAQGEFRVLFLSSMTVSQATGGGTMVFNLVEPPPEGAEVYYATPLVHPPHAAPLPELSSRIRRFSNYERPLIPFSTSGKGRFIHWVTGIIDRVNDRIQSEIYVAQVMRHVRELRINALLVCPQPLIDVVSATRILERTGLPAVLWFMDDYYSEPAAAAEAKKLWDKGRHRFVSSEAMQRHFSDMYGGDCELILSPVRTSEGYSDPEPSQDGRLRIAYAGAINSYYREAMSKAIRELDALGGRVTLDIYSSNEVPSDEKGEHETYWRRFPMVRPDELVGRLRDYDALLLLSSFELEWRAVAETAQAGKLADYLSAGRCIIAYGPEYAENIRYLQNNGIGETVTSSEPGALGDAVVALARDRDRRWELGKRAYHFGKEHRDKAGTSARLWEALRICSSSEPARTGIDIVARSYFWQVLSALLRWSKKPQIAIHILPAVIKKIRSSVLRNLKAR